MATLEKLPLVLVDAVIAFLCTEPQNNSALLAAAKSLILVNHEWLNVFDKFMAPRVLRSATITCDFKTRTSVLEMRRQVTLRGVYVERLVVTDVPELSIASQWATVLSHTPHVRELDLSALYASVINAILQAAADKCKQVRVLKLPLKWLCPKVDATIFSQALEAWHAAGGLIRMYSTPGDAMDRHCRAEAYVKTLAQFCPKLRGLDGLVRDTNTISTHDFAVDDQWLVSVATWKQFCGACKDIEAFEWHSVPFATTFFEIFGQSSKLKLRKLHFQAGHSDWGRYMDEAGEETTDALEAFGYGETAALPQSALRGCPQLEELAVFWERPGNNTMDTVMNPEIFGDEFIQEAVVRCPRLRRFIMREVNKPTLLTPTTQPIATLTDSAIRALAGLRDLREVEISMFDLSGRALYELVVGSEPRQSTLPVSAYREYRIQIVKQQQPESMQLNCMFVKAVVGFLELLAARELSFGDEDDCISLWLVQTASAFESWTYGKRVQSDLQRLAALVRPKHPRVELTVHLVFQDGEFRGEIESFGFHLHRVQSATAVDRPLEWKVGASSSADECLDTRLDEVFVQRERVYGLSDVGDDDYDDYGNYGDDDDDTDNYGDDDDEDGAPGDYYDRWQDSGGYGFDDDSDDDTDFGSRPYEGVSRRLLPQRWW